MTNDDIKDVLFRQLFQEAWEDYVLEKEDEIIDIINEKLKSWSEGFDQAIDDMEEDE